MNISNRDYRKYADKTAKSSPCAKNCVHAFISGGIICTLAELLSEIYLSCGASEDDSHTIASVTLIFIAALLTGIGIFDDIAKWTGAGTLVPITGFANAVVSPAIDTKAEGLVLGVGAKIFTVAGPVILYGTLAGSIYGTVYWIIEKLSACFH